MQEITSSLESEFALVGGDYTNINIIKRRALSKYLTMQYLPFLEIAAEKYIMREQVTNTRGCSDFLYVSNDNVLISNGFCKNRWCLVCNRIRTAGLINKYQEKLDEWKDKQFVTLTIPNVSSTEISKTNSLIHNALYKIKDLSRKKSSGCGSISGFRKYECTYNPIRNDFHPHFHMIVENQKQAEFIHNQWLKRFPNANKVAQDIRPATTNATKELFKYFTKLISKQQNDRTIYPAALMHIFANVRGLRVFQPFGDFYNKINNNVEEEVFNIERVGIDFDKEKYRWDSTENDWCNIKTCKNLTNIEFKQVPWTVDLRTF